MPSRKDSTNRSETFGRLLSGAINSIATYEGKTAPIVEEELGALAIVAGKTIQRYKSGHLPPEPRTIEILAEAAIRRGFLGREWLQRFLHAARYPFADKVLGKLCPLGPAQTRPPRIYENLPAPTYNQFVMRVQAFAEVIDGLQQRSAAVLIVGLGGNGKTSLAREVASSCLKGSDAPQFGAAVWVSDKDRPGTTNLSVVLDEIARTLDYPGFTQFEHDEKRREVEQLLKRWRVLVVVDNFETITDGALLTWLLRLPEPSKALITTREYRREFCRSSWPVDLRGMTEAEAKDLIAERMRVLKIEKLVGDLSQLEPLLATTGGNPKALEITLGLIKYEHRSLKQVVDDLYAARGELFDDLFTRAWALLDEAARRVLLVMTFFPTSANGEALAATADVQGFAFAHAVERLSDFALLDVQQENLEATARYALHPLVRALAEAKLSEQPRFEEGARERWVNWYVILTSQVGYCWTDLERLQLLDPEHEVVLVVVDWAMQHGCYAQTLALTRGSGYYYSIRGIAQANAYIERLRADAARSLRNKTEEALALSYYVQSLSRCGDMETLTIVYPRLRQLVETVDLPADVLAEYQETVAAVAIAHDDLDSAQRALEKACQFSQQLSAYSYIVIRHRLGDCLYRKGEIDNAQRVFLETLQDAEQCKYRRYIISIPIHLAQIALDRGNLNEAEQALSVSEQQIRQLLTRREKASLQYTYARLYTLRGDLPAARTALAEAIDLFERLGMRRELAEARAELVQLDEHEQTTVVE